MSLWLALEQAELGDSRPLAEVLDAMPWNADGRVTLRSRAGDNLGSLALAELVERLSTEARMPGQEHELPC